MEASEVDVGCPAPCAFCKGRVPAALQSVLQIASDLDGNLTNDTFHTDQWDANGHAILMTNSSFQSDLTYDPFGLAGPRFPCAKNAGAPSFSRSCERAGLLSPFCAHKVRRLRGGWPTLTSCFSTLEWGL
jgi:hypothetical protein